MNFKEIVLSGAYIITPSPLVDDRGSFTRILCMKEFKQIRHQRDFVQVNHSYNSTKGTLRGLHYQTPPFSDVKIVYCIVGSVFDVIVDIRENSPTFLNWFGTVLSKENKKIIYVPEGFAHGFLTLEDNSELIYFHSQYYDLNYEDAIRYNDPKVNVKWPVLVEIISEKDNNHHYLKSDFKGI